MLLRKDDLWLDNMPIPDVRNWPVVDENGQEVGFVETVVVDRQNNGVEAIMIGPNERFEPDEIHVGERVIRISRPLQRRPAASHDADIPDGFDEAYRKHFDEKYDAADFTYADLLPAYRFGREMALDADFAGRSASGAEEELRAHYRERRLKPPYDTVRQAVYHGYQLAHGGRPFESAGLDREANQILDPSDVSAERSRKAGASTSTMKPGNERAK